MQPTLPGDAFVEAPLPPDHHVHSEWSWDAARGSMEATCRRAEALGLPSIAFTEHADWARGAKCIVDLGGYLECIERCRRLFPDLRILSGVELGEPHIYRAEAEALLKAGPVDRLTGSLHKFTWRGRSEDASHRGFLQRKSVEAMFRAYLEQETAMVEDAPIFAVLTHLDYPKRYWPKGAEYDERTYEGEFRALLRACARAGIAIEINTTRGGPLQRCLCPGPIVLRWWYEEGGEALAFGSDAHSAEHLGAGFKLAAQVAEAAGFRPAADPNAFWVR